MLAIALLACTSPEPALRQRPPKTDLPAETTPADTQTGNTAVTNSAAPTIDSTTALCPAVMVEIDVFCIDAYEAHLNGLSPYEVPVSGVAVSAAGDVPQGYISAEVAARACEAAGKRLCTRDEWELACRGAEGRVYPYGDTYIAGACNEGRAFHPILELFGSDADWSPTQMNDPRLNQLPDSLAPSGSFPDCATPEGVYDLHGNLHEWVSDPDGTFKGGFYVDATLNGPGCTYTTTAHTFDYHDYSTGFRCCTDISSEGR